MANKYPRDFEKIDDNTDRLKVAFGWIVRTKYNPGLNEAVSIHTLFIKDVLHNWRLEDVAPV
jgi:hypothetical protein